MPSINVSVDHRLTPSEALNRIKSFLTDMQKQFGSSVQNLQENWRDNGGDFSFKAMGFNVAGSFDVEPSQVRVKGDLPLAASMMKGKIESTIRERLSRLLA